jgi:AraC family transcriptional regulator
MAYRRSILFSTPAINVEHIELLEMGERWSADYESSAYKLVMPLHGYVFAQTNQGRDVVDLSSALLLTPEASYRLRQPVAQSSLVLTIRDERFGDSLHTRISGSRCAPLDSPCTAQLHRLCASLDDTLAAEEQLLSTTASVFRNTELRTGDIKKTATARTERASLRAREYLSAHFREKFSLSDVASAVAASPFHLSRSFRARYGTTLFAQRERLRIAAALRQLTKTKSDLAELALNLGYNSHSHFSAAFARAVGCTPSAWRAH